VLFGDSRWSTWSACVLESILYGRSPTARTGRNGAGHLVEFRGTGASLASLVLALGLTVTLH
jgi:hypothetical protein